MEGVRDFLAEEFEVGGLFLRRGEDGQVRAYGFRGPQPVREPAQQICAGRGLESARQVQGSALGGRHRVPPAPGQVEHVAGAQDDLLDGLVCRRLWGFDVTVEGVGPGQPVQAPPLGSFELDHDDVVIVPVGSEALRRGPGGVHVDLNAAPEDRFEGLCQAFGGLVEFIHGVQDQ